jgi:large subunit ribosomal protein L10
MSRMLLRIALCCSLCDLLAGFHTASSLLPSSSLSRSASARMASAAVVEKKSKVVTEVREAMDTSMVMWCVRSEGIKVNDMNMMRQKFPEEVTVRCVKNTLVRRAAEEYPQFQGGDSLLEYSNYWFFVPAEHMRETYKTWNDWVEETNREEVEIVGGVFEGQCLDKKGIEAVTKLPTKQELMATTATLLTVLPTKLARTLNNAGAQRLAKVTKQAAGQKLVQAVKAMEGKKE